MNPQTDTRVGEGPHRCEREGFRSNCLQHGETQARTHRFAGPCLRAESPAREKESRRPTSRWHSCESVRVCDRVAKVLRSLQEYWIRRRSDDARTYDDQLAVSTRHRRGTGQDFFLSTLPDCSSHSRGLVRTGQTAQAIVIDASSLRTFETVV